MLVEVDASAYCVHKIFGVCNIGAAAAYIDCISILVPSQLGWRPILAVVIVFGMIEIAVVTKRRCRKSVRRWRPIEPFFPTLPPHGCRKLDSVKFFCIRLLLNCFCNVLWEREKAFTVPVAGSVVRPKVLTVSSYLLADRPQVKRVSN